MLKQGISVASFVNLVRNGTYTNQTSAGKDNDIEMHEYDVEVLADMIIFSIQSG